MEDILIATGKVLVAAAGLGFSVWGCANSITEMNTEMAKLQSAVDKKVAAANTQKGGRKIMTKKGFWALATLASAVMYASITKAEADAKDYKISDLEFDNNILKLEAQIRSRRPQGTEVEL